MPTNLDYVYIAGAGAYTISGVVLAVWLGLVGGTKTYRGAFGFRTMLACFVMAMTYLALFMDNGVTLRTVDHVEVAWNRYAGYIAASIVVGANSSAYFLTGMVDGWAQVALVVLEAVFLLIAVLSAGKMRYVWYGVSAGLGIFAFIGYYWGAQLKFLSGGRFRTLIRWIVLGVAMGGIMVTALLDAPLASVWNTGALIPGILFLCFDFGLIVGIGLWDLIAAMPAPGQQEALAGHSKAY